MINVSVGSFIQSVGIPSHGDAVIIDYGHKKPVVKIIYNLPGKIGIEIAGVSKERRSV